MRYDVMVSYRRGNTPICKKVVADLRRDGLKVWVDVKDIEKGAPDWWIPIEEGIRDSTCVVALLSPKYLASDVCALEIETAMKYGKTIIPVVIEDMDKVNETARLAGGEKTWADLFEIKERFRAYESGESQIKPDTRFSSNSVQDLVPTRYKNS